jgi:hypothetical protein
MPTKMQGWTGDFDTQIAGREPFTALIAMSSDEDSNPSDQMNFPALKEPYDWVHATCLTPNAMGARVTKVEYVGVLTWQVTVVPDSSKSDGTIAWAPGVHLFSIGIFNNQFDKPDWNAATFCSIIVPGPLSSKKNKNSSIVKRDAKGFGNLVSANDGKLKPTRPKKKK